jgi:hypothetical protein
MGGNLSAMRVYTIPEDLSAETKVAQVNSDDVAPKVYEISYTVPINSTAALIGVGFTVDAGSGVFLMPQATVNPVGDPEVLAMALVDMDSGAIDTSFPSFGIESVGLEPDNSVKIVLAPGTRSATTRMLPIAVDGANKNVAQAGYFRVGNSAFVGNRQEVYLYYCNASGVPQAATAGSYAQFMMLGA